MSFVDLPVSHGRLEGLLWKVERPVAAAVVCHPHPRYGGTMHNHVTYRLAQALREANVAALRFNFRGVGRSTGSFDEGKGELEDAKEALDFLAREVPGVPLWTAGFSFGGRVALELCARDERVEKALVVGLALNAFSYEFLRGLEKPKAIVQGDQDEFGALPSVQALVAKLSEPRRLFVVPECDHLATGRLRAMSAALDEAVRWLAKAT